MPVFLETLKTIFVFWHVAAFALGAGFVYQSYRATFGLCKPQKEWNPIMRQADLHLWLSGIAIIVMGVWISDFAKYFSNPKLWTKVTVVVAWLIATQYMRIAGAKRMAEGNCVPMFIASGVTLACWIYGAVLGCAKGLAYGVIPFSAFMGGFAVTMVTCLMLSFILANRRGLLPSAK